ncbi:MAG: GNAT family N-acetyltransferase [Bacillota bacterium]
MAIVVRQYTMDDFEGLIELQRESFPPPFPPELWWKREQIAAHLETFPAGAMVAELHGRMAGSATSLIIKYDGQPHTWEEASDNGYIKGSHQPDGDSLYGIDICVSPRFRGKGVAKALYDARKELVTRLGLKRFLAGARIPGFHHYASRMAVEDYVNLVVKGELHDPVLTFMLKQDLHPVQIIEGYLEDAESLNTGVLVEWLNPKL